MLTARRLAASSADYPKVWTSSHCHWDINQVRHWNAGWQTHAMVVPIPQVKLWSASVLTLCSASLAVVGAFGLIVYTYHYLSFIFIPLGVLFCKTMAGISFRTSWYCFIVVVSIILHQNLQGGQAHWFNHEESCLHLFCRTGDRLYPYIGLQLTRWVACWSSCHQSVQPTSQLSGPASECSQSCECMATLGGLNAMLTHVPFWSKLLCSQFVSNMCLFVADSHRSPCRG